MPIDVSSELRLKLHLGILDYGCILSRHRGTGKAPNLPLVKLCPWDWGQNSLGKSAPILGDFFPRMSGSQV